MFFVLIVLRGGMVAVKHKAVLPSSFKLNGNWAERIAVIRLRVLTCRCSSESDELRGKCRVWSGTLSHVILWRSSPQIHHQLSVIWHSSSKYRGVTKVLTKIVKVGISVLFFRLCVICNMIDGLVGSRVPSRPWSRPRYYTRARKWEGSFRECSAATATFPLPVSQK